MENIRFVLEKSARIDKLINDLYAKMPEIESARGVLVTESYKQTEDLPIIRRRSAAFAHILRSIPIVIRDGELIVGSATVLRVGVRYSPNIPTNGWKRNLTRWKNAPPTRSISAKRRRRT
jgi:pyruvate-formate lyase